MWVLVFFTLYAPNQWERYSMARMDSAEICWAVAAAKNADTPFTHDNMAYYACEYQSAIGE